MELEIGKTTVYLRKDVKELSKYDNGNIVSIWVYEEAQLSMQEYEEYLADMETPSVQSIMQHISDIQSEQEMQSITQEIATETIMQTLSDLQADFALYTEV